MNKSAAAIEAEPRRAVMLARLSRIAPKTAALVERVRQQAGPDCTELLIQAALQAAEELGPKAASVRAARTAEGAPMK